MEIPKQFKNSEFRFIKLRENSKKALEEKFNSDGNNYKYNNKEFLEYLKNATGYGILGQHGDLVIVDCDNSEVAGDILLHLPKTLVVRTGSSGHHFYFIVKGLNIKSQGEFKLYNPKIAKLPHDEFKKLSDVEKKEAHWGEVQYKGVFVVAPGSIHPNGNKYKILHDNDIAELSKEEFYDVMQKYFKEKKKFVPVNMGQGLDIDISIVAEKIKGLDKVGDDGLQGSHPIHGSEGGSNFRIDCDKNAWHCFRHSTGGDALSLIGVIEKIIDCEDCVPGYFKEHPTVFKEILKVAKEKYSLDVEIVDKPVELFIWEGKSKKLNTVGIVDYIKDKVDFRVIRDSTGKVPHIYYYKDGYYQLNGDEKIQDVIKRLFNEHWKTIYQNEIMNYINSGSEFKIDREDIEINPYYINFNNGVYDLQHDKLLPHDSKYMFLYKIPHDYNAQAKCSKILKYFDSTLSKEYIELTQELYGYCLFFDYPIAGLFYLYGVGGNGKGVWIYLLQQLIGTKNVVTKEISSLIKNRFTTCHLYGKLANICGELSSTVLKDSDTIKRLTAGDFIQAEYKNKDGFDFQNRAKIITSCNSIPYCPDLSYGWYQRQYIIPFLKTFRRTNNEVPDLKYKLVADEKEMEGLILWSLQGLKRLLKKRKFTYNEDIETTYLRFQRNTVQFIEENYTKGDFQDYLDVDLIRNSYIEWCKKYNIPQESDTALGRQLTYKEMKLDKIIDGDNWKYIRRYIKEVFI